MFYIGRDAIAAEVAAYDHVDLVEYVGESGTTIHTNSRLEDVVASDPDVLVLSFQINDESEYGSEQALAGFEELVASAQHIDCIRWVTFYDEGNLSPMVAGLLDLAQRWDNLEIVAFHTVVDDHPEWRHSPMAPFGGATHLDDSKKGPTVLGQMIGLQTVWEPPPL